MSGALHDPWTDAAAIAKRLAVPDAQLVVMLGAEGWCQKCRDIHPAFAALARQECDRNTTWLWLDLDGHAEFTAGFIPDGLPLLLVYRGAALRVMRVACAATIASLIEGAQGTREAPADADPGIWKRLARTDWASG